MNYAGFLVMRPHRRRPHFRLTSRVPSAAALGLPLPSRPHRSPGSPLRNGSWPESTGSGFDHRWVDWKSRGTYIWCLGSPASTHALPRLAAGWDLKPPPERAGAFCMGESLHPVARLEQARCEVVPRFQLVVRRSNARRLEFLDINNRFLFPKICTKRLISRCSKRLKRCPA